MSTTTHNDPVTIADAWRHLDAAKLNYRTGAYALTIQSLRQAVTTRHSSRDPNLMIESAILWRECLLRTGSPQLMDDCFDLAKTD